MSKVEEVLGLVEGLTVLELSDLVKQMEEKFGVTAAAPVAIAAGGAAGGAPAEEVKEEFDVVLVAAGEKKIQVLKVVREITGLGLKEAKDMTEAVPAEVLKDAKNDDANSAAEKLKAAGATVELK